MLCHSFTESKRKKNMPHLWAFAALLARALSLYGVGRALRLGAGPWTPPHHRRIHPASLHSWPLRPNLAALASSFKPAWNSWPLGPPCPSRALTNNPLACENRKAEHGAMHTAMGGACHDCSSSTSSNATHRGGVSGSLEIPGSTTLASPSQARMNE